MAREKTTKLQRKEKLAPFAITATVIMGIYSFTLVFPLLWAILCSLKGANDFVLRPFSLPTRWRFEHYVQAFTDLNVMIEVGLDSRRVYLAEMFMYSLIISVGCALIAEGTRAACAYCAAKYRHHKEMVFMHKVVVALLVISLPSSLAASIVVRQTYGIYNSLLGEMLVQIGFTGAHFLYYYAAFKGVSTGYMEAARIDGAGEYTIFFKIMLPLIRTTFFALFILDFIGLWNNYEISLVYLPSYPVVAYGLYVFRSDRAATNVPLQLAGCSLVILPTLVLFLIFKNKLIGSLSLGGLKG